MNSRTPLTSFFVDDQYRTIFLNDLQPAIKKEFIRQAALQLTTELLYSLENPLTDVPLSTEIPLVSGAPVVPREDVTAISEAPSLAQRLLRQMDFSEGFLVGCLVVNLGSLSYALAQLARGKDYMTYLAYACWLAGFLRNVNVGSFLYFGENREQRVWVNMLAYSFLITAPLWVVDRTISPFLSMSSASFTLLAEALNVLEDLAKFYYYVIRPCQPLCGLPDTPVADVQDRETMNAVLFSDSVTVDSTEALIEQIAEQARSQWLDKISHEDDIISAIIVQFKANCQEIKGGGELTAERVKAWIKSFVTEMDVQGTHLYFKTLSQLVEGVLANASKEDISAMQNAVELFLASVSDNVEQSVADALNYQLTTDCALVPVTLGGVGKSSNTLEVAYCQTSDVEVAGFTIDKSQSSQINYSLSKQLFGWLNGAKVNVTPVVGEDQLQIECKIM